MKANSVTQRDIARACGLAQTTVSGVLDERHRAAFDAATCRKVLAAARRLGYRPSRSAQLMRGGRSGMIGLITTVGTVQPSIERLHAATVAIRTAGFEVISGELLWSADAFKRAVDVLLDARVEGVLVAAGACADAAPEVRRLHAAGIPTASLGGTRFPDTPWVSSDYQQGMRDLTNHLLARGYRRLAHATAAPRNGDERINVSLRERIAGFREAAAAAGLADDEALVLREPAEPMSINNFAVGRTLMQRMLELPDRPRALLCSNDEVALGALAVCADAGLRVPDDIAVTGFDNTNMGQNLRPALTSVAQPVEACAKRAVDLLLRQVRGERVRKEEMETRFPCRVVARASG